MQKFRTYLEDVAVKLHTALVGYFMYFVLIDNKNVVVADVVYLSSDKEAFTARQTEKDLAAIVDMYIGIGVSLLGVIDAEACVVAGVCDGK